MSGLKELKEKDHWASSSVTQRLIPTPEDYSSSNQALGVLNNSPEVITREGGSPLSPSHHYVPQLDLSRVSPAHGLGDRLGSKFRSPARTLRNRSTSSLQVNHTLGTNTVAGRKAVGGSDSSGSGEVSDNSEGHDVIEGHDQIAGNTKQNFIGNKLTKLSENETKNPTEDDVPDIGIQNDVAIKIYANTKEEKDKENVCDEIKNETENIDDEADMNNQIRKVEESEDNFGTQDKNEEDDANNKELQIEDEPIEINQGDESKDEIKNKNKEHLDHIDDTSLVIEDEYDKENIHVDKTTLKILEETEDVNHEHIDYSKQKDDNLVENNPGSNDLDESGIIDDGDKAKNNIKGEEIIPSETKALDTTTDDHFIKLEDAITEQDGDKRLDGSEDIENNATESDLKSGGKITKHDANLGHKTHLENGANCTATESDQRIVELKANEAERNSDEEFQQKQILSGRITFYSFCVFHSCHSQFCYHNNAYKCNSDILVDR